nr:hypothetical protein Iba_chr07aCG2650 [Ipomoea batatas]
MRVAVLNKEIPVKKHRKSGRRHREKRRHRNIPPIPERHHPRQVRVVYNHIGLRPVVKPIQQLLHRGLQLGLRGPKEGREVLRPPNFRRDDVGDGGESQILRLGVAGDEAVPFFSENESEECVGAVEGDELAEIHHWVDVASPGIRHRHHVAFPLGVAFHLGNRRGGEVEILLKVSTEVSGGGGGFRREKKRFLVVMVVVDGESWRRVLVVHLDAEYFGLCDGELHLQLGDLVLQIRDGAHASIHRISHTRVSLVHQTAHRVASLLHRNFLMITYSTQVESSKPSQGQSYGSLYESGP